MADTRISGRVGQIVNLDVTFYNNGTAADPFAIRKIEIYKTSIAPHNLIKTINVVGPTDDTYPSPVSRVGVETNTEPTVLPGQYVYAYTPDASLVVPDVFFDVWYYHPADPRPGECTGTDNPTECEIDQYDDSLLRCCHRFWLYPDGWFCGDQLESIEFGFEPLNQKFFQPERKQLQVGLMPLPLYDFNRALVLPMMPHLKGTITISTHSCEPLVTDAVMNIGLRQGSYRTNPYVLRYELDSTGFLKGTYKYRITITLPDGSTRTSPDYNLVIV